jgi:hypothetical protein
MFSSITRPSRATVIASTALAIAITGVGGADAAGIIHIGTSDIRNGAVTNAKIKNKTISEAKLTPSLQAKINGTPSGSSGTGSHGGCRGDGCDGCDRRSGRTGQGRDGRHERH